MMTEPKVKATKRPYKWIAKELEPLDPYKDYEKIFRLTASYGGNDFINNLIYTQVFPNFIVTEHGALAVWREDGGKVYTAATSRVEQTEVYNDTWWYYGPSSPKTQKSVEAINKLHAHWAKQYPGAFSHDEDYVYTLAYVATFMHRLRLRMGLSGAPEKVQIASYIFMGEMIKLFRAEGGALVTGWPESWDGLMEFVEEFESRTFPRNPRGEMIATAIYEHFAYRFFPPSLRWLGMALVLSLSLPSTLAHHRIDPPNFILKATILYLFGCLIWLVETFGPDPQTAWIPDHYETMSEEEASQRKKEHKQLDCAYASYFMSRHTDTWVGCPYADFKMRAAQMDKSKT